MVATGSNARWSCGWCTSWWFLPCDVFLARYDLFSLFNIILFFFECLSCFPINYALRFLSLVVFISDDCCVYFCCFVFDDIIFLSNIIPLRWFACSFWSHLHLDQVHEKVGEDLGETLYCVVGMGGAFLWGLYALTGPLPYIRARCVSPVHRKLGLFQRQWQEWEGVLEGG